MSVIFIVTVPKVVFCLLKLLAVHHHTKIKKPYVRFIIKIFLTENECKTPRVSYIHFLSKILFFDKMDLRFFCLGVTIYF